MVFSECVDGHVLLSMIPLLQRLHFLCNIGRLRSLPSTDFVCQFLVVANIEVGLLRIGSSGFEDAVKLLNDSFCQWFLDVTKEVIKGNEMIGCLYDVIHRHSFLILEADGAGFKDVAGLLLSQLATFNSIRVVGELHLCLMIESSLTMCLLLINEK